MNKVPPGATEAASQSPPATVIRVLQLEDNADDAELVLRQLRRAGIAFSAQRVETREAFIAAMAEFRPQIILLDYRLPAFDGSSAIALVQQLHPDIPVVVVSGMLGDEAAVDITKAGARDFVLKDRLGRLGPAVRNALAEAEEHRLRRQTEQALRDSEQRFRALIEHSTDLIGICDASGVYTYLSPSAVEVIGHPSEDLIGRHYSEPVLEEDGPLVRRFFADLLQRPGDSLRQELRLRHAHGGVRYVDIVARNQIDVSGVGGIVFNARDITERRDAEAGLRLAHVLIDQSPSVLFRWAASAGWPVLYVSENIRQWGYSAAELTGGSVRFADLIHPDDRQRVGKEVAAYEAAGAGRFAQEYRIVKRSGEIVWIDDRTVVERDAAGKVQFLQGVVMDITARKRVELALRDNEQLLRTMSRAALDAVILMDADGRIAFWNEAAERQFGYSQQEAMGQDLHRLLVPVRHYQAFLRGLTAFRASGQGAVIGKPVEFTALRRDGSEFPVELSISSVQLKGCWNAVGIVRDITERKKHDAERDAVLRRAEYQLAAVSAITASAALATGEIEALAAQITEAAARVSGAERANVWLFNADETELRCIDAFELTPARHSAGMVLKESEYRNEFTAIKATSHVAVDQPLTDPRVAGYVESYIKPLGITSMLDVVIENAGKHLGLLCIEHVGPVHRWTQDEISFASQLADKLGLCVANRARSEVTLELQEAQRVTHIGNWRLNLHNGEVSWSEEVYRIFGLDPRLPPPRYAEHPGVMTPASFARLDAEIAECARSGRPYDIEFEILRPSGERRWVAAKGEALRDPDGSTAALRGTVQDITERQRQAQTLLRTTRALKALSHCNAALVHAQNEQQLYGEMCRAIVEAGGYRMAWAGLAEPGGKAPVTIVGSAGDSSGYLDKVHAADDERDGGPGGECIRSGQPQLCRDLHGDPRMAPWRDAATAAGFVASLVLPLLDGAGRVFGVLAIYSEDADAFGEEELTLLTEMAGDLAYGVSNLRLATQRHAAEEKLLLNLESAVAAIGATMEVRDPYTAGHQRRVATLAAAIARQMGLPDETIKGIHFGGLIHDIGKIQVPTEILVKPGHLSKLEYELIKAHPEAGYDIIKGIEFPWPIAQMVRQHHERIDGSGYPQGLKGEQILLEARILAVADALEAMASHRPYRPPRGIEQGLAELQSGRGSAYDPVVVDACVALFHQHGYQLPE